MPVSVCKFESCSGHDKKRDLFKVSFLFYIAGDQGALHISPQVTRKRLVQQIPSLLPTTPPNSPNLNLQPQVKNVPIPQNPSTEHTKRFLPKPTRLTSWRKRLPVREMSLLHTKLHRVKTSYAVKLFQILLYCPAEDVAGSVTGIFPEHYAAEPLFYCVAAFYRQGAWGFIAEYKFPLCICQV